MRDNNVAKSGLHKSVETFLYTIFLRVPDLFCYNSRGTELKDIINFITATYHLFIFSYFKNVMWIVYTVVYLGKQQYRFN